MATQLKPVEAPAASGPAVFTAMHAVMSELSAQGMKKEGRNDHQKFNFRGVDQVFNALSPLLAKHGLIVTPTVEDRDVVERSTQRGGVSIFTTLRVRYDFIGVRDGSVHSVTVYGEAADSGDKSHAKALSMAFKSACFQALCIPIEGTPDPDSETHELAERQPLKTDKAAHVPPPPEDYFALVEEMDGLESKEGLRKWALETTARRAALHAHWQGELRDKLIEHQNRIKKGQFVDPTAAG